MNKNFLLLVGGMGLLWYFTMRKPDRAGQIAYLKNWVIGRSPLEADYFLGKLADMNDGELGTVYEYIHDYVDKGRDLAEGSSLFNKLMIVSNKYEIFT